MSLTETQAFFARLTWWPDDAPMRANHRALCDVDRQAGHGCADVAIDQCVPLGADRAVARVQWTITRADVGTGDQPQRTAAGPRVLLCTAHQENLQELTRHAAQ